MNGEGWRGNCYFARRALTPELRLRVMCCCWRDMGDLTVSHAQVKLLGRMWITFPLNPFKLLPQLLCDSDWVQCVELRFAALPEDNQDWMLSLFTVYPVCRSNDQCTFVMKLSVFKRWWSLSTVFKIKERLLVRSWQKCHEGLCPLSHDRSYRCVNRWRFCGSLTVILIKLELACSVDTQDKPNGPDYSVDTNVNVC
jgi:hypothetical protein